MECLSCNIKELKNTKDERNHVNSIVARDFSGSSLDVSAIQQMLLAVSFQLAACTRIFGRKCECSGSVIFFGTNFETLQKLSFQVILAIITHCASRLDLTELIVFGCIGSNVWRKGPEKITTPAFFFPPLQSANVSTAVAATLAGRKPSNGFSDDTERHRSAGGAVTLNTRPLCLW